MYLKVIDNGHVIEVYEYEFPPNLDKQSKQGDKYNPLELDYINHLNDSELVIEAYTKFRNKQFHEEMERLKNLRGDRKDERRMQTLRDARNNLRRLALANFNENSFFITLTYEKNMKDVKKADDDFKKFIKRLKYKYGDLKYIAVREFQKRGAVHYHMISNVKLPAWNNEKELKELEVYLWKEIWRHGFVDIKKIDHVDNVGAYITKYMDKDIDDERLKGCKLYLCSKGLKRPKVLKGEEAIERLKEVEGKKIVFTSQYTSEYLGNIIYKEYNLKRS
jgi:predicted peroxiredoxin